MRITYAGVDLCFEPPNRDLADLFDQFQPQDWFKYSEHPYVDKGSSLDSYNWRPVPELKLNQLYLPNGASRFGCGFFLTTFPDLVQIERLTQTTTSGTVTKRSSQELEVRDDSDSIIFNGQFWALHQRAFYPGTGPDNRLNSLWLLPLVDERYWWQFRSVDNEGVENSWPQTFENLFGINLSDFPILDADYGPPNLDDIKARKTSNYGLLFDALASELNLRIVYDHLQRKPILKKWDSDTFPFYPYQDYGTPGYAAVPPAIKFYYRNDIDGTLQDDYYVVDKDFRTYTNEEYVRITNNDDDKMPFFPSIVRTETEGVDNNTEIQAHAEIFARDWFKWQVLPFDLTYNRLVEQSEVLAGWNDYILYSFGARFDNANNEIKGLSQECESDKLVVQTRIVSWPGDVINPVGVTVALGDGAESGDHLILGEIEVTEPVTDQTATFAGTLLRSWNDDLSGEVSTVTVENPQENNSGDKYLYVLKVGDYIRAVKKGAATDADWLVLDGPCDSSFSGTNPPTDILLSNDQIDEGDPGALVGTLSTVDADLPNDSHTYEIIGATIFEVDGTTLKLIDGQVGSLSQSPYNVVIRSTDSGGQSFTKAFDITVNAITTGVFSAIQIQFDFYQNPPANIDYTDYGAGAISIPTGEFFDWAGTSARVNTLGGDDVRVLVRNDGPVALNVTANFIGPLFTGISPTPVTIIPGGVQSIDALCFTGGPVVPPGTDYEGEIQLTHDGVGEPSPWTVRVRAKA